MADVAINENTPTFPETPPGFSSITLFGFPSFGTLTGSEYLETHDFILTVPFQITPGEWDFFFQTIIQPGLSDRGVDLAAYGVWEQPVQEVLIPTSLCVPPIPCIDLSSICPPIIGCLGGQTIPGFDYRVWLLTDQVGASAYTARGQVRAFVLLVIVIILGLVFGLPILLAEIREVNTGKITSGQLISNIKNNLPTPGEQINEALSPLLLLGLAVVASSIVIAVAGHQAPPSPITYRGNVNLPTPFGGTVGGGFETGPASGGRR